MADPAAPSARFLSSNMGSRSSSPSRPRALQTWKDTLRDRTYEVECPEGTRDVTNGQAYWWECGAGCPGGTFTTADCKCACVEGNGPIYIFTTTTPSSQIWRPAGNGNTWYTVPTATDPPQQSEPNTQLEPSSRFSMEMVLLAVLGACTAVVLVLACVLYCIKRRSEAAPALKVHEVSEQPPVKPAQLPRRAWKGEDLPLPPSMAQQASSTCSTTDSQRGDMRHVTSGTRTGSRRTSGVSSRSGSAPPRLSYRSDLRVPPPPLPPPA